MAELQKSQFASVGEWMEFYEKLFKEENPVNQTPLSLNEASNEDEMEGND